MLCFASYATLLKICKSKSVTQKILISKVMESVSGVHVWNFEAEEATISNIIKGKRNLPAVVSIDARAADSTKTAEFFKSNVIPLLNPNLLGNLIFALKDVVRRDSNIRNETRVEQVSGWSKKQIMENEIIDVSSFLAGIFIYVAKYTKNDNSVDFVKSLTSDYVSSFPGHYSVPISNEIQVAGEIDNKTVNPHESFTIDEDTKEEARIFCLNHEEELSLLPLCEMAAYLNPEHKHVRAFYTDFIQQRVRTQKAILIRKSLKPFEFEDEY